MESEPSDYEEENITNEEEEVEEDEKARINNQKEFVIKEHTSQCTFGDLYCCHPDKYGNYQIVIGSMWPFYAVVSGIVLIINIIFYYSFWNYLGVIPLRIGLFLFITSTITSIILFFSNPGIPNTKTNIELTKLDDDDREFCEKCHIWKETKTAFIYHCKECNCCIDDYELHSYFFGKCIAKGNYWTYQIYMVTSLLNIIFIIMVKGLSR